MEKLKSLRGQIFSYDIVFALMAASFLIFYAVAASNALADKITSVERENMISEVAQSALVQLTESPGDPPNWKGGEANSVGLAEGRGMLDEQKVARLSALAGTPEGYGVAKALLSMNRQGGAYNFSLSVNDVSGGGIYSIGPEAPRNAVVASSGRAMLMGGRLVHITIRVWGVEET